MKFKRFVAIAVIVAAFQLLAFALPSVVEVSDVADELYLYDDVAYIFADNAVEIDIGERASVNNIRFAEIDGVQTEIIENNIKELERKILENEQLKFL